MGVERGRTVTLKILAYLQRRMRVMTNMRVLKGVCKENYKSRG